MKPRKVSISPLDVGFSPSGPHSQKVAPPGADSVGESRHHGHHNSPMSPPSKDFYRQAGRIMQVQRSANISDNIVDTSGNRNLVHRNGSGSSTSLSASSTPRSQAALHRLSNQGSGSTASSSHGSSTLEALVTHREPAFHGWMNDSPSRHSRASSSTSGTPVTPRSPFLASSADHPFSPGSQLSSGNQKRFMRDATKGVRRASVLVTGVSSPPTQKLADHVSPDKIPSSESPAKTSPGSMVGAVREVMHRTRASTTLSRVMKGHWARSLFYAHHKPDSLDILRKPADSRSYIDCRMVYEAVREKAFFKSKVDMHMGVRLCGVMVLHEAEEGEWLCKQGDEADNFYILFSGSVEIWVDAVKDKPVAVLPAGTSFGELGLIRDANRAASVKTTEKMLLLSIGKEDYLRLLKNVSQREVKNMSAFLETVDIFKNSSISAKSIEKMCYFARTVGVFSGQKVMQQNQAADNLHFVMEGHVAISKRHRDVSGKYHVVNVAKLSTGQAFGLSEAMANQEKKGRNPMYGFTGTSEGQTTILIIHYRDFCRFISQDEFKHFLLAAKDQEEVHMERFRNLLSSRLNLGEKPSREVSSTRSTKPLTRQSRILAERAIRVDDLVGNRANLKLNEQELQRLQQRLKIGADGRNLRARKHTDHWGLVRKVVFDVNSLEAQLLRAMQGWQLGAKDGSEKIGDSLSLENAMFTDQQEEMFGPNQYFVKHFEAPSAEVSAGIVNKVLHILKSKDASSVRKNDRLVLQLSAKMHSKSILSFQIAKIDSLLAEPNDYIVFVPPPCVSNGELAEFADEHQPWAKWHAILNCTAADAFNVYRAMQKRRLNEFEMHELDYVDLVDYIRFKLLSNSLFSVTAKTPSQNYDAKSGRSQHSGQCHDLDVPNRWLEQIYVPSLKQPGQTSLVDSPPRSSLRPVGFEPTSPKKDSAGGRTIHGFLSAASLSKPRESRSDSGSRDLFKSKEAQEDDRLSVDTGWSTVGSSRMYTRPATLRRGIMPIMSSSQSCSKGALPDFFGDTEDNSEQEDSQRSGSTSSLGSHALRFPGAGFIRPKVSKANLSFNDTERRRRRDHRTSFRKRDSVARPKHSSQNTNSDNAVELVPTPPSHSAARSKVSVGPSAGVSSSPRLTKVLGRKPVASSKPTTGSTL